MKPNGGVRMRDATITLVELPPTIFGRLDSRLAEDAYYRCRFPNY